MLDSPGFRLLALLAALPIGTVLAACEPAERGADLVLVNGNIVTVDPDNPRAEGLAIEGDRIVAVGASDEIRERVGPNTEVIDLEGRTAVPGFIEGHGHFMGLGQARMVLDLAPTRSWEEIVGMVAQAAEEAEPGAWITGRGWHQERWDPAPEETYEGVPTHHTLSEVSPENPVLLTHASGHASFANARALELAGVTGDTPDPSGGTIIRDDRGEPTGFLRQAAQGLVRQAEARAEEEMTEEERAGRRVRQAELAGEEALSKGVTSFHDAGSDFATIDFFRELAEAGELPVRLNVMVRGESNAAMAERLPEYRLEGTGDHFLTVRSIKRQIDGALGTHGAWLLEPYSDNPETSGLPQTDPDALRRTAEIALEHGFQLNTHAIGDRGNREALDIYESLFEEAGQEDLRWRIEHAQHLHPSDIPRFGELGVIASMQGVHATSDGPWVVPRLGEERSREGAYAWRSLIDSGAVICNGTDAPVEDLDPIASYYASVSRVMEGGERFFPDQAMSRMEALESYTINCAYAAFQEGLLGSLEEGKLADVVVLSQDILEVDEEAIPRTEVDYTIVGGEVRFRR